MANPHLDFVEKSMTCFVSGGSCLPVAAAEIGENEDLRDVASGFVLQSSRPIDGEMGAGSDFRAGS